MIRRLTILAAALALPTLAWGDALLDEDELAFLRIINAYRAENGLGCLTPTHSINVAADWMSRAMGEQGFFSHNEPPCDDPEMNDCHGRDPFQRMRDLGHDQFGTGGENIAAGYPDAQAVFIGWKNSPGHNANMLQPAFTTIGIGKVVVPGSKFGTYWTNNFSDWNDSHYDCDGVWHGEGEPGGTGGSGGNGTGGSGGNGTGGSGGGGGTDEPPPPLPGAFWGQLKPDGTRGGECSAAGGAPIAAAGLLLVGLWWSRRK